MMMVGIRCKLGSVGRAVLRAEIMIGLIWSTRVEILTESTVSTGTHGWMVPMKLGIRTWQLDEQARQITYDPIIPGCPRW